MKRLITSFWSGGRIGLLSHSSHIGRKDTEAFVELREFSRKGLHHPLDFAYLTGARFVISLAFAIALEVALKLEVILAWVGAFKVGLNIGLKLSLKVCLEVCLKVAFGVTVDAASKRSPVDECLVLIRCQRVLVVSLSLTHLHRDHCRHVCGDAATLEIAAHLIEDFAGVFFGFHLPQTSFGEKHVHLGAFDSHRTLYLFCRFIRVQSVFSLSSADLDACPGRPST
jgi:hypothetical protein